MRYPLDKFRLGTRYGTKGSLWRCGWHSGLVGGMMGTPAAVGR